MLAKPSPVLPGPTDLPGGTVWEPKWDGYRGIVEVSADGTCRIRSRAGADLTGCFPDVAAAARSQLPPATVVDGELVCWRDGRVDFSALTPRLAHTGSRKASLKGVQPATLLAFDVLQVRGVDVRSMPLRQRRALLVDAAAGWSPPLQVTPQTSDAAQARAWLDDYAAADVGVEGLVAKGAGTRYAAGSRGWLKYRITHTREAVLGGLLGGPGGPLRLALGLPTAQGTLLVAGTTSPLTLTQARDLLDLVTPDDGSHPWPARVPSHRLGHLDGGPALVSVQRVQPLLVVEVTADTAFEHGRWRHPTRFVRVRPDLVPAQLPRLRKTTQIGA